MIVHPAGKRRDVVRAAVLVEPGRARSLDDGKLHDLRALPKTLRAFVSWDDADAWARSGVGELVAWAEEPIRYRHVRHGDSHRRRSDAVIVKLPVDTRAAFDAGLSDWVDWLADHDVNPGWSLGGSSMALLRATLERPLPTTLGELPPPRWTLGGRKALFVEHGTVIDGAVQLDLQAAYTKVIGGLRYGGVWRRLPAAADARRQIEAYHDSGCPVLVRARVILPDGLAVGPLHKRPQRRPDSGIEQVGGTTVPYPVDGTLQGLWTMEELHQALATGAHIRILEAFVHAGADRPFTEWLEAVLAGREIGGYGGQLAKATGNSLWGQFVIDDTKRLNVQRWNGSYKTFAVQGSRGHEKRAWDLGEIVCGTVRAKLYRALALAAKDDLVCADTDGAWLADTPATDTARTTLEREGWRVKTEAATLHVLDQQKYRYRLRRARSFQVICAGVPSHRSADVFQELWERFS